jgi:hypothetical protein
MIWGFSCHCSLPKSGENTIFVIPLSQAERLRTKRDVNLTEVAQQASSPVEDPRFLGGGRYRLG